MPRIRSGSVLVQIDRLFNGPGTVAGLTEAELLDRFVSSGDDAAFEALVRSHGKAVMAVCRHVLRDAHAADDAFQATFLVFARRAGSLRRSRPIGPWLVGVAYRIASKARVASARRLRRESVAAARRPASLAPIDPITFDLGAVLWEELERLPGKYRDPIVLCWVQGHTIDEAARRLRWPVGTVKGRLHRARETLRAGLSRRGITAPAAGLASWFATESAFAIVSPPVLHSTVKAAVAFASGGALLAGTVPAGVSLLVHGALRTMTLSRLATSAVALTLTGTTLVGGWGVVAAITNEGDPGPQVASITTRDPSSFDPSFIPPAPGDDGRSRDEALAALDQHRRRRFQTAKGAYDATLALHREGRVPPESVLETARAFYDAAIARSDDPREQMDLLDEFYERHADLMEDLSTMVAETETEAPGVSILVQREKHMLDNYRGLPTPITEPPGEGVPTAPPEDSSNGPSEGSSRDGGGWGGPGQDPASKAIKDKLDLSISMQFDVETPLSDFLDSIREATADDQFKNGIPIYVDQVGLQEAQESLQSPVLIDLDDIPLRVTLWLGLRQIGLAYTVRDGLLIISSPDALDRILQEEPIFQGLPFPGVAGF
ncbi:RNA polymerase sigma factor [Tautonia sp. JC769]|uniref:RNA polymerase sigma factor n=1 Tax=Tautonia sp. JC769 TaxID=3232135 RepID=UPI003459B41A